MLLNFELLWVHGTSTSVKFSNLIDNQISSELSPSALLISLAQSYYNQELRFLAWLLSLTAFAVVVSLFPQMNIPIAMVSSKSPIVVDRSPGLEYHRLLRFWEILVWSLQMTIFWTVCDIKYNRCLFERLIKIQKNGVFLFKISFFVLKVLTFLSYANWESDDVRRFATKKIKRERAKHERVNVTTVTCMVKFLVNYEI